MVTEGSTLDEIAIPHLACLKILEAMPTFQCGCTPSLQHADVRKLSRILMQEAKNKGTSRGKGKWNKSLLVKACQDTEALADPDIEIPTISV